MSGKDTQIIDTKYFFSFFFKKNSKIYVSEKKRN